MCQLLSEQDALVCSELSRECALQLLTLATQAALGHGPRTSPPVATTGARAA